jgi:superfamily II DNA or RNA helicase
VEVSVAPHDDDDDDDMLLLLGEAAPQKQQSPPAAVAPTLRSIKQLSWWGGKNARADIADMFHGALLTQLSQDRELFVDFEPFMHYRRERDVDDMTAADHVMFASLKFCPSGTTVDGAQLRPYQVEGVQYMLDHFSRGMSCILADDMGLGKTAQIASFFGALQSMYGIAGPHLVVAPLSTLHSWVRELARWAPALHVVTFHGPKEKRASLRTSQPCVFLTTPATFATCERGYFTAKAFVTTVIDEAHQLKNDATSITRYAAKLSAVFRIAVTGTPLQNHSAELWSVMSFLYPRLRKGLAPPKADEDMQDECHRLLRRIMLRRTKQSLDLGIPPRIDEPVVLLDMTPLQAALYDALSKSEEEDVRGAFMHLRKACNHPLQVSVLAHRHNTERLRRTAADASVGVRRLEASGVGITEADIVAPSAKMQHLDIMLHAMHRNGDKVLIFSNFTSQLDLLEGLCALRGYRFERLDGETTQVEREMGMARFNHPQSKSFVFLLTTTAGGVGVTLTAANRVVIYDSHFNPQMDRQAADRAHRLGQLREVRVTRYCMRGTIEERVLLRGRAKAEVADYIIDGYNDDGKRQGMSLAEMSKMIANGTKEEGRTHAPDVAARAATLAEEAWAGADEAPAIATSRDLGVIEGTTTTCFACAEPFDAAAPRCLHQCSGCTKAYHAECLPERPPNGRWRCARHSCTDCGGKGETLFMCTRCPRSTCFDCLDRDYLSMAGGDGITLPHVSKRYAGMEHEGMPVQRLTYYLVCTMCAAESDDEDDETLSYASSSIPSEDLLA